MELETSKICKHYVLGNCVYGAKCRFKHPENLPKDYFERKAYLKSLQEIEERVNKRDRLLMKNSTIFENYVDDSEVKSNSFLSERLKEEELIIQLENMGIYSSINEDNKVKSICNDFLQGNCPYNYKTCKYYHGYSDNFSNHKQQAIHAGTVRKVIKISDEEFITADEESC